MAFTPALLRTLPHLRHRAAAALPRPSASSAVPPNPWEPATPPARKSSPNPWEPAPPARKSSPNPWETAAPPAPRKSSPSHRSPPSPPPLPQRTSLSSAWLDQPDYRQWKDNEEEILKDIEEITMLTKDILHSDRYLDGERLSDEDEKAVLEKLLPYHPHSEDKIGCGLESIMVDRHPQFNNSRCLFVVRTDGGWIDFSYQKCLRSYIRDKYPSYGERFVREHFRRT